MVLMIRMTCTPPTGVLKKGTTNQFVAFQSILAFAFVCLRLSTKLSHVITLFLSTLCHMVSFLCSKIVSNNVAHIKKKIKKMLFEGVVNMFLFHCFGYRNQGPWLVLFNHIEIITCSNFESTEKQNLAIVFAKKERKTERKKRSFRNAGSPK